MKRTNLILVLLIVCALLCILLPSKKQNAPKAERILTNKEIAILKLAKLDATSSYEKWLDVLKSCRDSDLEVSNLATRIIKEKCHQEDVSAAYVIAFARECIIDLDYDDRTYHRFATRRPFPQVIDREIAEKFLYCLLSYELTVEDQEALLRLVEYHNDNELFFFLSLDNEEHFSLLEAYDKFSVKGKVTCLHFLGLFKDRRSIDLIVKCCSEERRDPNHSEITLAAVAAAGEIGQSRPDLIEALEKRLDDWKISVVIQSVRSLMRIKDHDAVPKLSRMLVEQSNFVATQEILRIFNDLPNERLLPAKKNLQEFVLRLRNSIGSQDNKLLLRDMPNVIELAEILIQRSSP